MTMQLETKLTLDGLMTLIAGVIAFVAVIVQIRSSSRQVRDQINAQRDAERDKDDRQRKAIAASILFEIDSFYRLELEAVEKSVEGWEAATGRLPSSAFVRQNSFDTYRATLPILGFLSTKSVSAIVKFYTMAGAYDALLREYQHFMDFAFSSANRGDFENCARDRLKEIRVLIPGLKELATTVSTFVARDCGLEELIAQNNAQTH